MKGLEALLAHPTMQIMGWALLHSLWQGVLVAALLAGAMAALRANTASARYRIAYAALLMMFLLPLYTAWSMNASPGTAVGSEAEYQLTLPVESTARAAESRGLLDGQTASDAEPSSYRSWRRRTVERLEIFLPWLTLGWLLGVSAMYLRLWGGWAYMRLLERRQITPVVERWQDSLERIARRLSVSRPVRLLESSLISAPSVVGWLRPVILLPTSALSGLSPQQLEAIIAHELAHIRRHDYLVNLFQTVIETLLFYHPAVWWVSRQVRIEREHACDDLAVAVCGDRLLYARALTRMERLRKTTAERLVMAANGAGLLSRVRRLVEPPSPRPSQFVGPLVALTLIITAVSIGAITPIPTPTNSVEAENAGVRPAPVTTAMSAESAGELKSTEGSGGNRVADGRYFQTEERRRAPSRISQKLKGMSDKPINSAATVASQDLSKTLNNYPANVSKTQQSPADPGREVKVKMADLMKCVKARDVMTDSERRFCERLESTLIGDLKNNLRDQDPVVRARAKQELKLKVKRIAMETVTDTSTGIAGQAGETAQRTIQGLIQQILMKNLERVGEDIKDRVRLENDRKANGKRN
jgi:beta-lactamase regulating signal transducer with metallopeptidase domain